MVKTDDKGNVNFDVDVQTPGKYEIYFELSKDNYEKTTKRYVIYALSNQIPKTDNAFFEAKNALDVTDYLKTQKPFVLDVRSKANFDKSHIENSFNMDLNDKDFDDFMNNLDKTTNLFGVRSKNKTIKGQRIQICSLY